MRLLEVYVLWRNKKMNGKYRIALMLIGVFAISLFSGCTSAPEAHKILIVQMGSSIDHIDNRYALYSSAYDAYVGAQWQGKLVRRTPGETTAWYPAVAKSVKDISGNYTAYEFELREGLTFHDGSAITASSILYSFVASNAVNDGLGVIASPGTVNLSDSLDDIMDEFDFSFPADDPNGEGLIFTIGSGGADPRLPESDFFFNGIGHWNRYMLVPEGSHGLYTDSNVTQIDLIEAFSLAPVSCGPYMFKEHKPQDHISFTRFDDWFGWGETFIDNFGNNITYPSVENAFEEIQIRIIPEPAMALVELETRGVDATTSPMDDIDQVTEFENKAGFTAFTRSTITSWMLNINAQGDFPVPFGGPGNYPFSEIWFRKVLAHAINRTNIVENVKGGIAAERTSFYPDWASEAYPTLDTSDYYTMDTNPAKAIQILEDNGYTATYPNGTAKFSGDKYNRFGYGPYLNETDADGDGEAESRGHVFKMVVDTAEPYKVNQGIAVAKDLENIGIYVESIMLDRTRYMKAISEDYDSPLFDYDVGHAVNGTADPDFSGPTWDMAVGGSGYHHESLQQWVLYGGALFWMYNGGDTAIYNEEYEIQFALADGGIGFTDYYSYFGHMPEIVDERLPAPYPLWGPSDPQYVEACEEAGRIWTNDMLSYIPFIWDYDSYAHNEHLKNFLPAANGYWDLAYCYWE